MREMHCNEETSVSLSASEHTNRGVASTQEHKGYEQCVGGKLSAWMASRDGLSAHRLLVRLTIDDEHLFLRSIDEHFARLQRRWCFLACLGSGFGARL